MGLIERRLAKRMREGDGRQERLRSNVLYSIPDHLLFDIASRVGRHGFESLGPLLATGSIGRELVYKKEVLKEVSLVTLLGDADLVHKWSVYHPFFMRCVKAGNVDACYLESLRLAVWEGKIEDATELLLQTSPLSEQMEYALGIFLISRGHYHRGLSTLDSFQHRVGSHDMAETVSQRFYRQCREITPVGLAKPPYVYTWRFDDVPECESNPCTLDNGCEKCFAYRRSIQFVSMF